MPDSVGATLVVVGGGPAGIAAAASAAELGCDTLLIDEAPATGGQIWRAGVHRQPPTATAWIDRLHRSGARILNRSSVFDAPGDGTLAVESDGRVGTATYERLVIATGAREMFLPFPGWTLPGVVGIGGVQALVKSGASVAGQRVVIAGSGPLILPAAATLAKAGARLELVAEQAPGSRVRSFALGLWRQPSKWGEALGFRMSFPTTRYRTDTWVLAARGDDQVHSVVVTDGSSEREIGCDLLAASYGLVPNLELARLIGCEISSYVIEVDERQKTSVEEVFAGGEVCGVGGVDLALVEGRIAGLAAADQPVDSALVRRRESLRRFARRMATAFDPRPELLERLDDETIVCRCEDVPWGEIDPSWSMRKAKLYLRSGMGPCQGRICGPILGRLCGWQADTVRPPLKPVSARALAQSDASTAPEM